MNSQFENIRELHQSLEKGDIMLYETGSVRQIYRRLRAEGHCVSEASIRAWIKSNLLPASYNGKKAYIKYSNVLQLLERGTPAQIQSATADGIRKINC